MQISLYEKTHQEIQHEMRILTLVLLDYKHCFNLNSNLKLYVHNDDKRETMYTFQIVVQTG